MRKIDAIHVNQTYGNWIVIQYFGRKKGVPYYTCTCVCGVTKEVGAYHLIYGTSKSCGCKIREARSTHGMRFTPEYAVWHSMKDRCLNSNSVAYAKYGGRGITVCERWKDSFENFIADVGTRPTEQHSIDRIDNNGDYNPDNCRWATRIEQARNQSTNRLIEFKGETRCLSEWVEITGLNRRTIRQRFERGWPIEEALTQPPNKGVPLKQRSHWTPPEIKSRGEAPPERPLAT